MASEDQELSRVVTRVPAGGWLRLEDEDCPLRAQHWPGPLPFDEWARELAKTHKQMRCEGCHRWRVWVPIGGSAIINGIHAQVIAASGDRIATP